MGGIRGKEGKTSLKNAGVDMSKPDAIELALQDFEEKIEKFLIYSFS